MFKKGHIVLEHTRTLISKKGCGNKMNYCIDCNKKISNKKAKRCRECYIKTRIGHFTSQKTRKKISEKRKKQIPPMLYKKHSSKTKKKMSEIAKKQHRDMSKLIQLSIEARKGKPAWNKGISAWWVKGKNHPCWKGGISKIDKRMHIPEWKEIRKKVYARDNWTCQICGKKCNEYKGQIQCHHIVPYRITQDNSIGNLITLCRSCHIKEEWKYYRQLKGQSEFSFW